MVEASADTDTQQVAVNENSLSLGGGFGTISIGNVFSAGTMIHNRGTTLIPTAEPDNNAFAGTIQQVVVLLVVMVLLTKLVMLLMG